MPAQSPRCVDIMSRYPCAVLLLSILVVIGMFSSGCILMLAEEKPVLHTAQIQAAENLTATITGNLTSLGDSLTGTAEKIADDPDNRTLLAEEFAGLSRQHLSLEALFLADRENRIIGTLPENNTYLEAYVGTNIENPYLISAADSPAMNIIHFWYNNRSYSAALLPMTSASGTYEGALIALIDSSRYYDHLIPAFRRDTGYSAWIIDGNGDILYDPDAPGVNKTILQLKSPDQMQLDRLIADIRQKKSGTGTYAVYDYEKGKVTTHAAAWNTVTPYKGHGYSPKIVVTSELVRNQKIDYPVTPVNTELEEFVLSAYRFARENGHETALAEFNKPNGRFTTEKYYIAAFDMNNVLLANPYRQELIGTDRTNYTDLNGVPTVRMFTLRASQGGGYVTHMWGNPADNMREEIKISYVVPVNRNWYIQAGTYHPEIAGEIAPELRDGMIQYAREIKTFVQETGKEEAVAALNNASSYRTDINLEILDVEGNYYVHLGVPEPQENIMGRTDIYGTSIGREIILIAEDGGGFQYVNLPMRKQGVTNLSLIYVEPIDAEWFVLTNVPFYTLSQ